MGGFWNTIWPDLWKFLLGAGGLALINWAQTRWQWKAEREAKKEDKAEAKVEEKERLTREREDKLDEMSKDLKKFFAKQDEFNGELSQRVKELEDQNSAQNEGMKYVLLDRILYLGQKYITRGSVSFDDRKRLGEMHTVYHTRLKGNGDADAIMDGVYELPLQK